MDFGEAMQQKTEQLSLDFSDRGEARKRWSKGRLVSSADEPERRKPVAPGLAEGFIEAMVSGKCAEAAYREISCVNIVNRRMRTRMSGGVRGGAGDDTTYSIMSL